ncbi:MAG: nif-specific transcriptional activator NifA [Oxalobacteraceae bacterium]|nr:nif-specific transcriptional activator NifA [Oxalobacteraceae bacterium]
MANIVDRNGNLRLVTIYEISKILGSSLDLSKTLREVLNVLVNHLEARRGMLSLMQESGELHLVSAVGISGEEFRRGRYQVGEGITGKIFQTGIPSVVSDISQEPLFLARTGSRESADGEKIAFVGVPIIAARETLGVLCIYRVVDSSTHSFDDDVRFLTMVANLIGQTVRLYRSVTAERSQLLEEQRLLKKELHGKYKLDNVIGISKAMQEVFAEVHQSAPSRSTMLLRGESGTGKEVIARAIHYLSPRKDGPFIKLNCAALSETLLESELFGHEKGAFTGAQTERKGRFELAHGGTLFLDEIGDISPAFQAKLLRVLQEREFERVGGSRSIKVDVRLITATNRDLEKAVTRGDFRADLYYRINVVSIFMPPLRERREDIPYLVEHFLDKFRRENQRKLALTPQALNVMTNCFWPGNVRELENCVERTATMVRGDVINEINFSCSQNKCLTQLLHEPLQAEPIAAPGPLEYAAARGKTVIPITEVSPSAAPDSERERLIWALEQCGWVQAKAARVLNISPRQMGYALQKYNIEVKKF